MINWIEVDFKKLSELEKKYTWARPPGCSACGGVVWGHGFVRRYFAEAEEGCWIKRYRCPDCRKVITMRPIGYWPRYWHKDKKVLSGLEQRLKRGRWPEGIKRQVGGHWLGGLVRQVQKVFGFEMEEFPKGFAEVLKKRIVPVSRSKKGVMIPQLC